MWDATEMHLIHRRCGILKFVDFSLGEPGLEFV